MESRDPDLWCGIRVGGGALRYYGRTVRGLEALTFGGQWYLHYGQDVDGVWLYRLPRWWQFKWKRREIC